MQLVVPSHQYQQSYIRYVEELGREERYPFPLDFAYADFDSLLSKLDNFSKGIELPQGFVPSTTLWLVDKSELVGVTNLRHFLNEKIEYCGGHIGLGIRPSRRNNGLGSLLMKLSIEHLSHMGVKQIHIHCYQSNLACAHTIVTNGGVLHSEVNAEGQTVQRYLVDAPNYC
ncbi:GNAT family N-acetyltransferase [Aliiglaciecola sp. LCG003]|uniref:GNAT family N-acetyltransferase n=1 Tax=Aliiglaciecola sp. LCG003 TaxID=3053655 RepID=UPI00257252DD|nr:GNAT family N-acetyltransferase [Aliiglaciecola sp. LCG003]WJG07841.1 GNAT family N-acetyltransferase [Aliiglaciecola sp. LCG003]